MVCLSGLWYFAWCLGFVGVVCLLVYWFDCLNSGCLHLRTIWHFTISAFETVCVS